MKKLGLIGAVLLVVAAPALATVTITCTQVPNTRMVDVSYAVSGDPNKVRGFALDVTVNNGAKIIDVNNLNVNYWVYPGSIVIVNGEVNDVGSPVADPCFPGTLGGLDTNGISIEMGSLYYPTGDNSANAPPLTGNLLRFKVDKDCCVTFAENTVRGGVVLTDPALNPVVVAPGIPSTPCFPVVSCPSAPASITYPASDCDGSYTVSWAASAGVTSYQAERSANAGSTWAPVYNGTATSYNESGLGNGSYRYRVMADGCSAWCTGTTDCVVMLPPAAPATLTVPASDPDGKYTVTWTASTGAATYQLESTTPAQGTFFTTWVQIYSGTATTFNEAVGGGTWSYRVKATNAIGCSSGYTNGSNTCQISPTECLKSTDPNYSTWKLWRYPACWCFKRQCRGDANGTKLGQYWVQLADLNILKAGWQLNDTQLALVQYNGICGDFNHGKLGQYRVQLADLTRLKAYWQLTEPNVPCCDTAAPAGDCTLVTGDLFNWWAN